VGLPSYEKAIEENPGLLSSRVLPYLLIMNQFRKFKDNHLLELKVKVKDLIFSPLPSSRGFIPVSLPP
jgi:hypothetical protein